MKKKKQNQENKILKLFKPYVPEAVTYRILEGKESLPSERREATVVFIDINGFTTLAERMDPEKATKVINSVFAPIVSIIEQYGGSINKFLGDGLMAIFGTPFSHENDPERAARASLEIMKSIAKNGKIKNKNKVISMKARIGINTGLCISGEIGSTCRKEFTVIGDTVNLASRLQEKSTPGSILIGEKTFQRIKDFFIFSKPRELKIKGKKNPVTAYILKREKNKDILSEQKRKYYTQFIGREKELKTLKAVLKNSFQSRGKIVEISGESGIGKTRLISELTNDSYTQKFILLSANCTSWEESKPYYIIKEIFNKIFQIKFEDEPQEIKKKIENKIKEVDASLLFASSYFLRFLSTNLNFTEKITNQFKRESDLLIGIMKKLFWSLSIQQPLLIIIEDMQWIDTASAEFLSQISKEIKEYPVLIIYSLQDSLKKNISLFEVKKIRLLPLKNKESKKLINFLDQEKYISSLMKDKIISMAHGNPLFIEEIISGIEERRWSLVEKDKLGKYSDVFDHFEIPDTVQSIARARIDLLPLALKEILYQASVLGKNIEIELLKKVINQEEKILLESLKKLQNYRFIEEITPATGHKNYFAFIHSIIQEIAYNSLLFEVRKDLHNKIGLAIEEIYSTKIDAKSEELAYHFKNSDNWQKALFYLNKAGDKAQFLYAFKNAIYYYLDSIKILESQDRLNNEQIKKLSEIYNKLAFSQSVIGKRKEAKTNFNKALKYSRKIKDQDNESLILINLGNIYGDMGQWDKSIEYLKKSLSLAIEMNNQKRMAIILKSIGLASIFKGDTSTGYSYLKESIDLSQRIKALDVYAMALNNIGIYYDMLGKWEKAIEAYQESLSIAQKNKNIIVVSNIMNNIGFAYSSLGDSEKAIHYLKESVKIADKIGDIYNKGINYIHLGEEYLKKSELKEVEYYISQAEKIFKELEDELGFADIYKLKGRLYKECKNYVDAELYFQQAIKLYSKFGDRINEAESYYEWGDMLKGMDELKKAALKLKKARKILYEIGTKRFIEEINKCLAEIKL